MALIRQVIPTGRPLYQFVPKQTFEVENLGIYVKDMVYTVREGNRRLHDLVTIWAREDKVVKI